MKTHGHYRGGKGSPEVMAWDMARNRCHNSKAHAFADYGGRGITMCDRWRLGEGALNGFECFLADMGLKPSRAHSLDRIDNNKGYEPGNCRWATRQEQMRNTRLNRVITIFGEEATATDWAERAGMDNDVVIARLAAGWKIGRALSQPVRKHAGLHYAIINGERIRLAEAALRAGISPALARKRIGYGWTVERAISMPSSRPVTK